MATIEPNFESICINPNDDLVLYKKEIVRSRIEKFLYAICSLDTDDLPTPLSRIEELYNCLVTGEDIPTFTPLSRAEKFVMAMLGAYDVELLPTPISRSETLMKKIATGDNNLDDIDNLQSRYEFLLAYIIKAGGFNGGSPDDPGDNGDFYYKLTSLTSGFTTINDTFDMPVKNAVLRGQTLVNVLSATNIKVSSKSAKVIEFNVQPNVQKRYVLFFKLNKIPTISDNSDNAQFLKLEWYHASASGGFYSLQNKNVILDKTMTINIPPYTGVIQRTNFSVWCRFFESGELDMDVMLVEYQEEMENWDIPYFEGMQSVKMPVLTTVGKNLFDITKHDLSKDKDGDYIATKYYADGKAVKYNLKKNTTYIVTTENNVFGGSFNLSVNGQWVNTNTPSRVIFTTDDRGEYYIKIGSGDYNSRNNKLPKNIQIEEGSTATPYEPHKSTTVSCNEEVELRGIGDIKDELNLVTGELTQRIQERVLDGSENWIIGGTGTNYIKFRCENYTDMVKSSNAITCDRYAYNKENNASSNLSVTNSTTTGKICIVTSQTDLSIDNFKAKLNTDKPTIQYQLAEPIVKTVDLSTLNQNGKKTKLSTFDDITHVTVSSEGLVPTGDIDIARPIQFVDYSLDNSLTTLYNTIEYPVKSAILKGNTLVNLASQCEVNLSNTSKIETGFKFNATAGSSDQKMGFLNITKPNTYYTYIFTSDTAFEYYTGWDATNGGGWNQPTHRAVVGLNVLRVKTEVNTTKTALVFRTRANLIGNKDVYLTNFMILEGDYTNVDIPYFTGMQSVKMPVLTTTGKNIYNKTPFIGYIDSSNGKFVKNNTTTRKISDYIEVKPNTTYKVSGCTMTAMWGYDKDKNPVSAINIYADYITTTNDMRFIAFNINSELEHSNIQIEEGTVATPYEPFKTNILTCTEEVELRGVGEVSNRVEDELDLLTGEVVERVGEFVLDGSEDILQRNDIQLTDKIAFQINNVFGFNTHHAIPMICNNFNVYYIPDDKELIRPINGSDAIVINISTSKCNDLDSFKTWLSQNPVTVQYQLETESIKTVDLSIVDQDENALLILENGEYIITENGDYINVSTKSKKTKLSTFDDITHVTVSSEGLVPTGEITVATKNATDVADASVMSLRMDDILNSQRTLEGPANAQSDDIDVAMLGTTDIYEQLL